MNGWRVIANTAKPFDYVVSVIKDPAQNDILPEQGQDPSARSNVRAKVCPMVVRALVVDDDNSMRMLIGRILARSGFDHVEAEGGEEAVALYRALAGAIDIVVLDLDMPGMDGIATYRALRAINPHLRAVLCSGSADSGRVNAAMREGFRGFVAKPFSAHQVVSAVLGALPPQERPDRPQTR